MFRSLRIAAMFIVFGVLLGAGAAVALNVLFPPAVDAPAVVAGADATPAPAAGATAVAAAVAPPPNSLVFTQEEVNTQVTRTLREVSSPVPVRDVQVHLLGENRVEATGRASMPFQGDVPVTVAMTVAGSDGRMSVSVESVKAAGMQLPQAMVQQLMGQVMTAAGIKDLNNIALPQGYESLSVEAGRVVVRKRA